jgi:hypothetical protein
VLRLEESDARERSTMSERDVNGEEDKSEAGQATIDDLEVLDGENVRGGADGSRDDGPKENITFVYWKM